MSCGGSETARSLKRAVGAFGPLLCLIPEGVMLMGTAWHSPVTVEEIQDGGGGFLGNAGELGDVGKASRRSPVAVSSPHGFRG